MKGWQRLAGSLILTVVAVQCLDRAISVVPLPEPASQFIELYDAFEEAGNASLFERVLYSWTVAAGRM